MVYYDSIFIPQEWRLQSGNGRKIRSEGESMASHKHLNRWEERFCCVWLGHRATTKECPLEIQLNETELCL